MTTKHTNGDNKLAVKITDGIEQIVKFNALKKDDLFNIMLPNGKISDILWRANEDSRQENGYWTIVAEAIKTLDTKLQ